MRIFLAFYILHVTSYPQPPMLISRCSRRHVVVLSWLLSITAHLSWGQVSVGKVLGGLSLAYKVRLETLFPYQQALLPAGVTSSRSYCEEVGSMWSLSTSEVICQPWQQEELARPQQEFSELRYLNGHWRAFFTQHYQVSPVLNGTQQGLPSHDLSSYVGRNSALSEGLAREEIVYLHHNFDPIRLLEQQLPPQPETRFFYVLDTHPATWGDTLAAYFVQPPTPDGLYTLTLWRRKEPLTGHWQSQRYLAQQWEYSPATHLLLCQQSANGYQWEWRRQYAPTGSDYVEVLRERGMMDGGTSGVQFSNQVYERRHTHSTGWMRDTYTVLFPDPTRSDYRPNDQVSFTVITEEE